MPELPEVETVRGQLGAVLPGRQVTAVAVSLPRMVHNVTPDELASRLVGRRFGHIGRRGKFLLLHVDDTARLIIHLRMTGRLVVAAKDDEPEPHTRMTFALDGDDELRFADVRTFGTLHYSGSPGEGEPPGLVHMGPEPLEDSFTPDVLGAAVSGRRAPIKAVLLDQRRVAGLGNIYVDEALYLSGVHPERPGGALTDAEIETLYHHIRSVLKDALVAGGTTIRNYVDGRGVPGEFQQYLHAYGRAGEKCGRCGTQFVRLKVAGRSSHVCPNCQT